MSVSEYWLVKLPTYITDEWAKKGVDADDEAQLVGHVTFDPTKPGEAMRLQLDTDDPSVPREANLIGHPPKQMLVFADGGEAQTTLKDVVKVSVLLLCLEQAIRVSANTARVYACVCVVHASVACPFGAQRCGQPLLQCQGCTRATHNFFRATRKAWATTTHACAASVCITRNHAHFFHHALLKPTTTTLHTTTPSRVAMRSNEHKQKTKTKNQQNTQLSLDVQPVDNAQYRASLDSRMARAEKKNSSMQMARIEDQKSTSRLRLTSQSQFAPSAVKKRSATAMTGGVGGGGFSAASKRYKSTDRRVAMRGAAGEAQLEKMILDAFDVQTHYTVKEMQSITNQPAAFLKEQMRKVAVYVSSGEHASKWRLKDDYAGGDVIDE
jgi:hypothetical protein